MQPSSRIQAAADPADPVDTAAPVRPDSFLTLHSRISLAESGADVVNTFGGKPATLQIGLGHMAETLERCLVGMPEGARATFELAPGLAFGERNPALVQRLARRLLDENSDGDSHYQPGDLVDFPAPGGGRYAGVLKVLSGEFALFDFNHPLAGQAIDFEVHILGVL